MERYSVVLTFEFARNSYEMHDHSNETSLAAFLQDAICFSTFYIMKFKIFLEVNFIFVTLVCNMAPTVYQ